MLATCTHKTVPLTVATQINHIDPDLVNTSTRCSVAHETSTPSSTYFSECHTWIWLRNHHRLPELGTYVYTIIIIRSTHDSTLLFAHEPNGHQISYPHLPCLEERCHQNRTSHITVLTEINPDRWSNLSSLIVNSQIKCEVRDRSNNDLSIRWLFCPMQLHSSCQLVDTLVVLHRVT